MKADQELRSLKRGLKVLALLNQVETVGVSELSRMLALPRTTTERILLTLASEGYVERPPNEARYRLSAKVYNLARGFSDDNWIIHVATPLLFEVTRQIGWPLGVATPRGEMMVLRMTTDPATSLWLHRRRVGAEIPMLGSSSGLVAFALAGEAERANLTALMRASEHAVNREAVADPSRLYRLIQPVLTEGYAFQPPPNDASERSISVPIRIKGQFDAALLMMYMTRAVSSASILSTYLPLLKILAARIGESASGHHNIDQHPGAPEIELPEAALAFGKNVVRA
jgi:IclR family mhp operon transcriptional activator